MKSKHLKSSSQARASTARSAVCTLQSAIIPDIEWETIERTINASIHELVYALHHAENDEIEEALDALTAVALNVETIQQAILTCALKSKGEK